MNQTSLFDKLPRAPRKVPEVHACPGQVVLYVQPLPKKARHMPCGLGTPSAFKSELVFDLEAKGDNDTHFMSVKGARGEHARQAKLRDTVRVGVEVVVARKVRPERIRITRISQGSQDRLNLPHTFKRVVDGICLALGFNDKELNPGRGGEGIPIEFEQAKQGVGVKGFKIELWWGA